MGGTKKKPISRAEKGQEATEKKEGAPPKEKKGKDFKPAQQKQAGFLTRIDDKQALKALTPIKAITLYSAARALGVGASAALPLLRSLEAKGTITKVGGYSGHYVWALSQASPSAP